MTPDSLHVSEYQVTRQDQCKQKLGPRTEPIETTMFIILIC